MCTLEVVWKDLDTRQRFVIGTLIKQDKYRFRYNLNNITVAQDRGFKGLIAFPDFSKEYVSDVIFPTFGTRLPDKKRKDITNILAKYGLDNYDPFELLKKSGGRLPIDTLEFIEPIDIDKIKRVGNIVREFFIAGVRHWSLCDDGRQDEKCTIKIPLNVGESLRLEQEPDNQYDKYAIAVYKDTYKIGYIPLFYSRDVKTAIVREFNVSCIVKEFNNQASCQECLKAVLTISQDH